MAHLTDWKSLSEPNEEWETAVSRLPARPSLTAFGNDMPALRQYMADARKKAMLAAGVTPGISIIDHQVTTRDGVNITCRVYAPDGASACPLAMIFHGGGWCIGTLDNEDLLCKGLAAKLGCIAVNVDYRLAPEHVYPTAINDCYDATKWAISNSTELKADLTRGFLLSGPSAGGNMVAVVALMLRDEKQQPPVTGTHLMIPAVCTPQAMPEKYKAEYLSFAQNKDADILSAQAAKQFIGNYVPDDSIQGSADFNPLIWKTGLKAFPTTYFQVCGNDPLRDEALIFERVLRQDEGVRTKLDMYPGLPHSFWSVMPTLKVSQQFRADSLAGLEWLLAQK